MAVHFSLDSVHVIREQCALSPGFFQHVDNWKGDAIFKRQVDLLQRNIASLAKEFCPGEGCTHFKTSEACGHSGLFAGIKNLCANALPCPVGMDEEGAD